MLRTRPAGRRRSGTDCWRRARTREWDRTPRPVHVARFPGLLATGSSSTPRLALYPAHPTPRDQQGAPEAAGLLSGRGLSPRPGRPVVRRGRRHRRPGGTRLRRRARATRQRLDARDLRRAPRPVPRGGSPHCRALQALVCRERHRWRERPERSERCGRWGRVGAAAIDPHQSGAVQRDAHGYCDGGWTNTILHLLAAAQEAEVDFDQATSVRGRGHAVHAPSLRA